MSNEQSIEEEIARTLDNHSHGYDSDCGLDFGCECGAVDDYDNSTTTHAKHLAEVLSPLLNHVRAEAVTQAAMEYEIWLGQPSEGSRLLKRIAARIEQNSEGNET